MSVGEKSSKSNKVSANNYHIKFKHKKLLKIQKLLPNAMSPTKASKRSIGYDIYANNNTTVPSNNNQLIDTGLAMTPPQGSYIRIAPRSGLAFKKKIQIDAGVINPDYTGEIKVLLSNHSSKPFQVNQGDKIVQIILEKADSVPIKEVKFLLKTDRGSKGFGSSSNKENQAQSNICNSNHKTSKSQKIINKHKQDQLIILLKLME